MRSQTLGQAATLLHLLDSPTTDDHSDRLRQAAAFSNFCIAFRDTSVSIPEPDEADVVLTRELGRLVENSSYDDLQARIRTEDQTPSFCDVRPPSNHEVFAPPSVFWGDTHTLTFIATGQRADGTVTIVQAALPVMRGVPIQFLRDAAVAGPCHQPYNGPHVPQGDAPNEGAGSGGSTPGSWSAARAIEGDRPS